MSKYHYIYRITNLKLNRHYYGARTSNVVPELDLGVKYFSSSKDKSFIEDQKSNPQDYKYKVIRTFKTRKEAIKLEIKLHDRFDVGINESFYNRSKQSSIGFDTTGMIMSKETIQKQLLTKVKNNSFNNKDTEYFIKKSIKVHGHRYVYSDSEYIKTNKNVKIICRNHGEFQMTPLNHIAGQNCPKCSKIHRLRNIKQKYTWKDKLKNKAKLRLEKYKNRLRVFKERSNLTHSNKYDYSNVNLKSYHEKVNISCPIHGEFIQSPRHHVAGHGCQRCSKTHYKFSSHV